MTSDPRRAWTRVVRSVLGFGKKYGRWPTHLRVPADTEAALREAFGPDEWADLGERIQMEVGGARIVASEGPAATPESRRYTYGESLASRMTYTVVEPEPAWLARVPPAPGGVEVPELADRLERLGFPAGSDSGRAVQRAVLGLANQALDALQREADGSDAPSGTPQDTVADLLALVAHPQVAHELTAAESLRVQRAALRVAAAELAARVPEDPADVEAQAEGGEGPGLARTARELIEAVAHSPLPLESLERLEADPSDVPEGQEPLAEELQDWIAWARALAVVERRTGGGS